MKKYLVFLVISAILIVMGTIVTISELLDYSVSKSINSNLLSTDTNSYNVNIDNPSVIIDDSYTSKASIVYDDSVKIGLMKIKATFYDELVYVNQSTIRDNNTTYIYFDVERVSDFNQFKKLFNISIDGFKNKKIYDFSNALKPEVVVTINSADKEIVKIGE